MIKINSEQTAYNIGYDNPALPYRGNFLSPHMVISNAYYCGQADAQNHAPRASDFRLDDYDFPSCERKSPVPVAPDARSITDEHKNSEREIASLQYRLEEAESHLARLSVQEFPEDVMQIAAQACRDADYSPTNFDGTPSIVCKAVARAVLAERQKWSAAPTVGGTEE